MCKLPAPLRPAPRKFCQIKITTPIVPRDFIPHLYNMPVPILLRPWHHPPTPSRPWRPRMASMESSVEPSAQVDSQKDCPRVYGSEQTRQLRPR